MARGLHSSKPPDQLGLLCRWYFTVASEGGEDVLVPQVLGPCLKLFSRAANAHPQRSEFVPGAMRFEISQFGCLEGLLIIRTDRPGAQPLASVAVGVRIVEAGIPRAALLLKPRAIAEIDGLLQALPVPLIASVDHNSSLLFPSYAHQA